MLNRKKVNKGKGKLITFEGIDGSGKSTQIRKIKNYFLKKNIKNIYFTREPGGTSFGDLARKLLLNNSRISPANETQILLLTACRFEHYKNFIDPHIKKKNIVISDRFEDSTYAYQCGKDKELEKLLNYFNVNLFEKFRPDLTILLDIKPEIALKRLKKRRKNNHYDNKALAFYKSVRRQYKKLALNNKRIKIFDGSECQNILFDKIKNLLLNEINK